VDETIETARLILKPFRGEDTGPAFSWFGDPEVMRFMPAGPDASPEQTAGRIDTYIAHQDRHGFSKWIILDRETRTPIGDAGLMVLPGSDDIELGYRLTKSCWGRGLATEAASAWLSHAFDRLGLSTVIAFAHRDHRASLRVMEKSVPACWR
jgi:RimJ/RimL family protein N-acetyltransferase